MAQIGCATSELDNTPELESLLAELRGVRIDLAEEAKGLYNASERLYSRKQGEGTESGDPRGPQDYADRLRDEINELRLVLGVAADARRQFDRAV